MNCDYVQRTILLIANENGADAGAQSHVFQLQAKSEQLTNEWLAAIELVKLVTRLQLL